MATHVGLVLRNPAKWRCTEAAINLKKVARPDYDPQTGSKGSVMKICPACGDQVAVTLRYCPRCTAPLPEPGYGRAPGYYAEPGHYLEPGHYAEPGNYSEPEYDAEPGYRPAPGYPGPYLPAPPLDAPSQPGQYETARYQPGQYEEAPYRPRPRGPVRRELDLYREAPYEDDPGGPDRFGDRFAGGGPETVVFPARRAAAPVSGGEWDDTASRLLSSPPGPPRQARWRGAGHRARTISAALAAAALLAGAVTAWAAFGGHQGAAPGARLAGRQTAATRQASPGSRGPATPSPSPTPQVPAPGGAAAVVTMAPGLSQDPDAAQVDGFLVSYFTAINAHDFQQYARLLVPARRAQLSAAAFAQGYGTTTDTAATLVGISPTGRGVAATVTFTSEQRTAPGADVTGCTYWDITLYLQKQDGTLLIGSPPAGYHAYHHSCP
jgi:hypothetical protein